MGKRSECQTAFYYERQIEAALLLHEIDEWMGKAGEDPTALAHVDACLTGLRRMLPLSQTARYEAGQAWKQGRRSNRKNPKWVTASLYHPAHAYCRIRRAD